METLTLSQSIFYISSLISLAFFMFSVMLIGTKDKQLQKVSEYSIILFAITFNLGIFLALLTSLLS